MGRDFVRQAGQGGPDPRVVSSAGTHADRLKARAEDLRAECQSHDPMVSGGQEEVVRPYVLLLELIAQFQRAVDIRDRAQLPVVRGDLVGPVSFGPELLHHLSLGLGLARPLHDTDLRAEQVVEQKIALGLLAPCVLPRDDDRLHPQLRGRRGGLAGLVGLGRRAMHEHVRALLDRRAECELELPGLVAPERESGEIVPLDEDPRPAQRFGETGAVLQRRGKNRQPHSRQSPDSVSQRLPSGGICSTSHMITTSFRLGLKIKNTAAFRQADDAVSLSEQGQPSRSPFLRRRSSHPDIRLDNDTPRRTV